MLKAGINLGHTREYLEIRNVMISVIAYSGRKAQRVVWIRNIRPNFYGGHKQTTRQTELGYNLGGAYESAKGEVIEWISMNTKLITWFKFINYF